MEEVQLEADRVIIVELQQLKQIQESYGYKPIWVYYQLIKSFPNIGLVELCECANLLGYKKGWAWFKWQELQQIQTLSA